jgi:hypothetical protein
VVEDDYQARAVVDLIQEMDAADLEVTTLVAKTNLLLATPAVILVDVLDPKAEVTRDLVLVKVDPTPETDVADPEVTTPSVDLANKDLALKVEETPVLDPRVEVMNAEV